MRKIIFLATMFCLIVTMNACTKYNYQAKVVLLGNKRDLVLKYNIETGRAWVLFDENWERVIDNDDLQKSVYLFLLSSGMNGDKANVFRVDTKTGQSWKIINMKWIKLD